jgi:hypothetical protein
MELGIRLSFVKTSDFGGGGGLKPPNPPRYAAALYYSRWRDGQDITEWKSPTLKVGCVLVAVFPHQIRNNSRHNITTAAIT